ncbi:MAG: sensor histidine kinase [Gaiellaceae bacterium]
MTRGDRVRFERWLAKLRLCGVAFAALEVGVFSKDYPVGYEAAAWIATALFAAGSLVVLWLTNLADERWIGRVGLVALAFDFAFVSVFATVFSYEYGSPTRQALIFIALEGALRYGLRGGSLVALALLPVLVFDEWFRAHNFGPPGFLLDRVSFPFGIMLLSGLVVGGLVGTVARASDIAADRAAEAEALRDVLGHRVDILEAANRCARALGSSLELEAAFAAFIREVRGLVPFDRMAVVLAEGGRLEVLAAAGVGVDKVFPVGSSRPIERSIFEELGRGQTIYRRDMLDRRHSEEEALIALGLRSRLTAPLLAGAQAIGLVSFVRCQPDGFTAEEVEVVTLIGRLAANAVQNIRAYDAERHTVEELRRLSALRADFVSLVSHELRSPMAAVIGSARTLQARWRELSADQREAFLALIADETTRLANLIGEVLDTSRIEAGTFSYAFSDVDLGLLVEETVAMAAVGQDEVRVNASVRSVPQIRADPERLRQVVANLLDNAVKYSSAGDTVDVEVGSTDASVVVVVRDHGPGIPRDEQGLIFEKFGRAKGNGAKPGSGLGLFIARSIAEAHGGTLDVTSAPGRGATFILELPLEPRARS